MKFTVVSFNRVYFEERVAELCKKFKVEYELEWSDKHYLYKDDRGFPVHGYTVDVVVPDFDVFVNTGYTFLGSIHNDGAIIIVPSRYAITNNYSLSELKDEISTFPCNECGKKIARKVIHVFKNNETGIVTVYGSGCALKKFGVDFASYLYKFTKLYKELESDDYGFGSLGYVPAIAKDWCEYAYYNVVTYGYVSRSAAYDNPGKTSTDDFTNDVYTILTTKPSTDYERTLKEELPEKLEEVAYDHDEFVEWAENYVESLENNDFSHNLKSCFDVVKDGYVIDKLSGYLAYLVFKYWYEVKKVSESSNNEYNTDYSDLNVKDRLRDIPVEVVNEYTFEGYYGPCTIWTFRGLEDNRKYKWFTGKSIDKNAESIILTGTIKKFEDDATYGKAIVLTRCIVDYN